MKKSGFIILGIVIVVIAILVLFVQNQSLQSQLAAQRQQTSNFTMQTQCASDAATTFQQVEGSSSVGMSTYTDHWDESLQKCFILINNTVLSNGRIVVNTNLSDALEQKIYANIDQVGTAGTIIDCTLYPDGQDNASTTSCSSRGEFNSYVNPFMNN